MKFTRFIVYLLLKSHIIVQISANFIDFLSAIFRAQNMLIPPFLMLPTFILLLPIFTNFCRLPPIFINFYTPFTNFHNFPPTFTNFYHFLPTFILLLPTFTTFHQVSPTFYHFSPAFCQLPTKFYATNASSKNSFR